MVKKSTVQVATNRKKKTKIDQVQKKIRKKKSRNKLASSRLVPSLLVTLIPGVIVTALFVMAFLQVEKNLALAENEIGAESTSDVHLQENHSHEVIALQKKIEPDRHFPSGESLSPLSMEFKQTQNLNPEERIEYWSAQLEARSDVREKLELLVQGFPVDDVVPLIPKRFDCTTYVETVAALARSETPESFLKQLVAIRYKDGKPGFFDRNHFPEGDWIPNNLRVNILKDITFKLSTYNKLLPKTASKLEDRGQWLKSQVHRNQVPKLILSKAEVSWMTPRQVHLEYIPISDLDQVLPAIPSGGVVNLVHRESSKPPFNHSVKHPVLIAHQGFLIRKGKDVLLRHASTNGQIRTVLFKTYIKKRSHQYKSWPLIGINLNQIVQSNGSSSDSNRFKASM
jgi:hypothetical protein